MKLIYFWIHTVYIILCNILYIKEGTVFEAIFILSYIIILAIIFIMLFLQDLYLFII
jgi:hypothetical protein